MKQSLKYLWKNKRRNSLLMVEFGISFLVLFALLSIGIQEWRKYVQPTGFEYENVWYMSLDYADSNDSLNHKDEIHKQLKNLLSSYSEIDNFTFTKSNVPYTMGAHMTTLHFEDRHSSNTYVYHTDDNFADVLNLEIVEGRWFDETDYGAKTIPILINKVLLTSLFNDESPVGKEVHSGKYKVIGIVKNYRHKGEFAIPENGYFVRNDPHKFHKAVLLKVKSGVGMEFEEKLLNNISALSENLTVDVNTLEHLRKTMFKLKLIPLLIFALIAGFLIINVILGMFGVLWHNISLRRQEIGIRRAVGSTGAGIYSQLIGEMLILATLGMLPAIIIAAQFPILNVFNVESYIYLLAIGISAVLIYLLVGLSAVLPGKQATKIQPAMALHED